MKNLTKKLQQQFDKMCQTEKLFRSSISGQDIWDIYINSFKPEHNPVFRDPESSMHNCNLCKNFIRRYGNIVAVDENYNKITIWDIEDEAPEEFRNVVIKLSLKIKSNPISDVFFETYDELNSLPYESCSRRNEVFKLGIDKNFKRYTKEEADKFGVVAPDEIREFNHLHLYLPKQFVSTTKDSVEQIMGKYRDSKNVFQRAMEEIPLDTLNLVKDLINQGSLLDGQTHLYKIEQIIPKKREYDKISNRDNWCWVNSYNFPLAKFKNELIGVLCSELAEGKELNEACKAWNKRVDPANYMKAVAPITKRQIEEAKKFVEENGYEESFDRRFATIDDIKASEILHLNAGDGKIKSVSIFDDVKSTSTRHKRSEFDNVEEVGIDKFMKDILPSCTSVEAYLSNSHERNMVSLTTANNSDSKPIFKWSNNYSWTFNGNLAGKSQIKENVKNVGGNIDALLRCSLQWNDEDTKGNVDLDLHCRETCSGRKGEIYYLSKKSYITNGWLDVDMIRPEKVGIENITWQKTIPDGVYEFFVRNYCGGGNKGFKAEIEFGGNVFNYYYKNPLSHKQDIKVATIRVIGGVMSIEHHLPEDLQSKEMYNLDTNQFHKVNLVCLSPNHWSNNSVGNKHYFFMLEGCKCPVSIRSFHSENLIPELAQHRKVLEVLGNTTMIQPSDKQLSGLGFNATVRDELVVRLKGSFKRVIKIKF